MQLPNRLLAWDPVAVSWSTSPLPLAKATVPSFTQPTFGPAAPNATTELSCRGSITIGTLIRVCGSSGEALLVWRTPVASRCSPRAIECGQVGQRGESSSFNPVRKAP
jgi:hypothetical protein